MKPEVYKNNINEVTKSLKAKQHRANCPVILFFLSVKDSGDLIYVHSPASTPDAALERFSEKERHRTLFFHKALVGKRPGYL